MEAVGGVELKARQDGEAVPIELTVIPQLAGEYKLTLRAQKQPGELVTTNNEISTFVTVLKGGVNVLYLEGALRVDQKFLRRSLDASPDINVDYVRLDEHDPKQRPVNLNERLLPGKYDVYMIGDVDASLFTAQELEQLAATVRSARGWRCWAAFIPLGLAATPTRRWRRCCR